MAKWCWPLIISLFIHAVIFAVLMNRETPLLHPVASPAMKAYVVSLPSKIHSASTQTEKPVKTDNLLPTKAAAPVSKKSVDTKVNNSTQPPIETAKSKTHEFKKIDLNKGLKSIKQQYQSTYSTSEVASTATTTSNRITVPKERAKPGQPILKVEQQNMQFTTYRNGDKCFKKVFIGGGSLPKNDLPDSYLTGSQDCPKTKITQAYDIAMDKWLNKSK